MFKKAAESVVQNCGSETLHAVTDLNSAERFKPLCLVQKKKSFWPFKAPTIIPSYVKITDLLSNPVDVAVITREFTLLKSYNEFPTLDMGGSISAKATEEFKLDLKGDEKVKLVMKLGDIEKVEVSWQQLHKILEKNVFNCDDQVYKNAKRSGMTLCVVIESICTKGDGSVEEDSTKSASAEVKGDASKFVKTAIIPEVHANGSIERKEDKSFILPPNTVLAYGCVELSVTSNSYAKLHATYDMLDGASGEMIADAKYANKHEVPAVSISRIEAEMHPLMKSSIFGELQKQFKALLSAMRNDAEFRIVEILLHAALSAITDSSEDKSMLVSTLKHYTGSFVSTPLLDILRSLKFSVSDPTDDNSPIEFPSADEQGVLKSCTGLVDSLLDVSVTGLKKLPEISAEHTKLLLNIVQDLLEHKDVDLHSSAIHSMIKDDPHVLHFLTECGFLKLHKEKKLVFTDHHSNLLDIYAVIFFFSTTT